MLIIGERINTSRKGVEEAVRQRDTEFVQTEANKQAEAGAHMIDANAGTLMSEEVEAMQWLVDTIQAAVDLPISLDSPRPEALEAGLKRVDKKPMINSITAEEVRYNNVLPLVKEYETKVIALAMGDAGIPPDAEGRITVGRELVGSLTAAGIKLDNIYADPLVFPIANGGEFGLAVLDTIRTIKAEFPGIHASAGVSNVSHGLPQRKFLNQAFTVMCMTAGLDAAIIDPMDKQLMALVYATEALLGHDDFCAEYLSASREGKFE